MCVCVRKRDATRLCLRIHIVHNTMTHHIRARVCVIVISLLVDHLLCTVSTGVKSYQIGLQIAEFRENGFKLRLKAFESNGYKFIFVEKKLMFDIST